MHDLPPGFPFPDPVAAAHGARVEQHLRAAIAQAGGWLDFARFMELALYAPGLGYYSAGAAKLGAAGDFVTAPERGALFGRCVARALLPVLEALPETEILELGAGSGALAQAVLGELAACGALPARYAIVEPSADLAERQRERFTALPARERRLIAWEATLPRGGGRAGLILANEVADALPVRRFRWRRDHALPLGVVYEQGRFREREGPPDPALDRLLRARLGGLLEPLADGYESELCSVLPDWLQGVLGSYDRGLALIIDYGLSRAEYYAPQRRGGTLRCHYRHRAHSDPLLLPGLQDITAWVDFTTAAEAAVEAGWEVAGFATQAHFLLDAGLLELLTEAAESSGVESMKLQQQAKALTLPGEMGERFRVLALTRGLDVSPRGFGFRDLRDRL